jgi:predicted acetyltransferase
MEIEIRVPDDAMWPEMVRADGRAFGYTVTDEVISDRRRIVDLERFRVAVDGGAVVGVAGSFGFDITLPGGTTVPAAGVTWVSVAATHRRQGVLTQLMAAVHADADERGEPVAVLYASEGSIYERFGYGIATTMRFVEIARRRATLRPDLHPDRSTVRYADGDAAAAHRARVWDVARRQRAGEVSRSAAWNDVLDDMMAKPMGSASAALHLVHPDGYASYRMTEKWHGDPDYRLDLLEFVATTPQAHLDLWHAVLSVDLVGTIAARQLPSDEPLPLLLTDVRPVATTVSKDGIWAKVLDPAIAFGARAYGTADRFVVEADGERWAIDTDGTESSCRRVRSRPDIVTDAGSLGALLFGGVRPSVLARGRHLEARSADVLRRADACFVTGPAPHCATWF